MKILVTGGAGFIGSHLVDALVAEGQTVRVLDSLDPQVHGAGAGWPSYAQPKAEYVRGDVRDAEVVRRALAGVEVVIHDAAAVGVAQSMYEIVSYVSANSLGAAVLLQEIVARKAAIKRLVVASSMSIYGEGAYLDSEGRVASPSLRPDAQLEKRQWELVDSAGRALRPIGTPETKPLQPTSVYAVSKRDHEELFLAVGNAYGIPTVALRYFNVYGSRQALSNPYTGVAAIFSSRLLNGNRPLVTEDGEQSRDFVHVSDIVRANLAALRCEAGGGRVCNVGSGRPTTIRRVAELLAERLEVRIAPDITGKFRAGDIRHCFADPGHAKRVLGFEVKVRLEDGIDEVIEFARAQKPRDGAERAQRELVERGLTR
jgi:dTDP-L-rhamnose 4-epimerase